MKKEDELLKELTDMVKETKKGQIKWKLSCQTTEYNDEAVMASPGLLMSATCHMSVPIRAVIL